MAYTIRGTPWVAMADAYDRGCCVIDVLRSRGVAAGWANNYDIAFPAITGVVGSPNAKVQWLSERMDAPKFAAMTPQAIADECAKRITEVQG